MERRDASGFLALAMAIPDARECARTPWRAWQRNASALPPTGSGNQRKSRSTERPEVGALWADGRRLAVTDLRATGPLENVFWHQARPGEASLFLALLCGSAPHVWSPNAPWTLALRLVTHPE